MANKKTKAAQSKKNIKELNEEEFVDLIESIVTEIVAEKKKEWIKEQEEKKRKQKIKEAAEILYKEYNRKEGSGKKRLASGKKKK